MNGPDTGCLNAVRVQIEQAQDHLVTACKILRTNGWPENADELMRSVRHVQVWTQKDGWLDALARPPIAAPDGRMEAAE